MEGKFEKLEKPNAEYKQKLDNGGGGGNYSDSRGDKWDRPKGGGNGGRNDGRRTTEEEHKANMVRTWVKKITNRLLENPGEGWATKWSTHHPQMKSTGVANDDLTDST